MAEREAIRTQCSKAGLNGLGRKFSYLQSGRTPEWEGQQLRKS